MSKNILLISDLMIKERTAIHGNIDPKLIYPDIKYAQDIFLMPLLGTALFNKMQTIINDDTITTDATLVKYKYLLDTYIVDALMYYVMGEMPETISYQFWNKGVVRKQGENTENPSMSELIQIGFKYKQRAETYAERMRLYLLENANQYFLEYLNPGNTIDTVVPGQRAFTCPIYLGHGTRYPNWRNKPYHD